MNGKTLMSEDGWHVGWCEFKQARDGYNAEV